jgi:hypothetical protein
MLISDLDPDLNMQITSDPDLKKLIFAHSVILHACIYFAILLFFMSLFSLIFSPQFFSFSPRVMYESVLRIRIHVIFSDPDRSGS